MNDEIDDTASEDAASAAFEKLLGVEETTQEAAAEPAEGVESADGTEVAEETQEASSESQEAPAPTLAGDDALVEIGEGDSKRQVPVKDLKALLARETEITERDTKTAAALQRADQEGEKAVAVLSTLIQEAETHWQKYATVDFALMAQQLPPEAYKQLRADHQEAWQRVNFLKAEANQFVSQVQTNRATAMAQALKDCDEVLSRDTDPLVKGWNSAARAETVAYAVSQGLSKENAEAIVQPAVIKLLRKAAAYDKGQAAVAKVIKPVATSAPKAVLTAGAHEGRAPTTAETKLAEAKARLKNSGSVEDAEAAFLARLG